MIDKELIRQAAEDIDIFEADLSQEYDRIARAQAATSMAMGSGRMPGDCGGYISANADGHWQWQQKYHR
jgi:hypothetical protein